MSLVTLTVNGRQHNVDVDPSTPLLYVLSDDLALNGPKFGRGLAQCGACTVLIDGRAVRSCVTPMRTIEERAAITRAWARPKTRTRFSKPSSTSRRCSAASA